MSLLVVGEDERDGTMLLHSHAGAKSGVLGDEEGDRDAPEDVMRVHSPQLSHRK